MASGGWGLAGSNPFSQPPPSTASTALAGPADGNGGDAPPPPQRGAFGAWGAGLGAGAKPAAAPAPQAPPAAFGVSGRPPVIVPPPPGLGAGLTLEQREAAVARREAELQRREAALAQTVEGVRPKNFPPFCPIIYHSISEQIPPWNRSMMRWHFLTELIEIVAFFYNTVIQLAAMFAGLLNLTWWLFSLISFSLGLPLSWLMYYRGLFNASRTDGATYAYMRAVISILINIAWCIFMVLGINGIGEFSGGIFPMMRMFQAGDSKSNAFGVMYIVNVVLWALAGLGGWFSLGLSIAAYRRGDAPRLDYEARYGPATGQGAAAAAPPLPTV